MKMIALTLLAAAALAAGCAHKHEEGPAPDYEGTRQRAERSHSSADKERGD